MPNFDTKRLARIPVSWKFGLLFLMLAGLQLGGLILLLHPITTTQNSISLFWTRLSESMLLIFFTEGLIVLAAIAYVQKHLTRMNKELKHVLNERRLSQNLSSFYQAKTLDELVHNTHNLFGLFKSFDHMKAARINVETQTLKAILNNIQEGVILVNTDRVVTHINHTAESMLRLIPGEIIAQTLSRKVSCPAVLDSIARTIAEDHKFLDIPFCIREGSPLTLDSYPIKNTFGEVVRVAVIIREK